MPEEYGGTGVHDPLLQSEKRLMEVWGYSCWFLDLKLKLVSGGLLVCVYFLINGGFCDSGSDDSVCFRV